MFVQQFFVTGLAHSSYLLGGASTCAIIDPRRDVEVYVEAAKNMGVSITHILETHLHADFISGHRDLAEKTGAQIYAPRSAGCKFDHVALGEGDTVEIEDMRLSVLETAGHTPEHISYVVTDTARGDSPVAVFCGDTLFVGYVGRPELFPGRAPARASRLFDNLHGKLLELPDFCEVYPAHGAGSLCGRAMGAKRTSTIGYEKEYNAALQTGDKDQFIESLTTNMPPAPDHFSRCSAINGRGPALVRELPRPEGLEPAEFSRRADQEGTIILDTRSYEAFGGQHVPGAYHIDFGGNFATFAGWVLPPDADMLLVAQTPQQAEDATVWLRRVGLDRTTGYLDGGMYRWARAGLPTAHVPQISVQELHTRMTEGDEMLLVDVRAPREFAQLHIDGAVNIPGPDLRSRHEELQRDIPLATICSTGHRSSLAASLLKRRGFDEVRNVAGGMTGYGAAGFAAECPLCVAPHLPRTLLKHA